MTGGTATAGPWWGTCGDLYIRGTYNTSLTLAAQNDAVIAGSVLNSTDLLGNASPTGTATLGIVANSWVRVLHPVTKPRGGGRPVRA